MTRFQMLASCDFAGQTPFPFSIEHFKRFDTNDLTNYQPNADESILSRMSNEHKYALKRFATDCICLNKTAQVTAASVRLNVSANWFYDMRCCF